MRIGTRTILFGAHQFVLHPLFVALAWWRLYGPPRDPRLWIAFVVHDLGYWGLSELDGEEGVTHPHLGAALMGALFDRPRPPFNATQFRWTFFAAGHSRTYAALLGIPTSDLMAADKLATALYPRWLYALLCWMSGEYIEYRDRWVAAGTYPGRTDDGAWAYCGHLQRNWARFKVKGAIAGKAYGGE